MIRLARAAVVIALATLGWTCGGSPTSPNGVVRFDFNFDTGPQGWTAGQADYPVSYGPRDIPMEYQALPAELDGSRHGLYLYAGGEGIFTFIKGRATGLRPQVSYQVSFQVEFATNTALDVVGAGGPPGEGTFVKAGVSAVEPTVVPVGSVYRMNIDKGDEGYGGDDALLLGNIGISRSSCQLEKSILTCPWQFKQLTSGASTMRVQAASDGSLWFLLGTDQMFFGPLPLYYTRFTATLTPE